MTEDQLLLMHPAVDIFRDHLLSEVKEENKRLREDNELLEPACDFLAKIELRLRSGRAMFTTLKQSFAKVDHSDDYSSVPIDCDPRPLVEFSEGGVGMLGQNIGSFRGASHLVLGIRRNGAILLRFSLSKRIAVEGVLQGLSNKDHDSFQNKSFGGAQITLYLTTGLGLQNPDTITFTSTMLLMDITPEMRTTLKLLDPLPSHKSIKDDLVRYLKNPRKSKLPPLTSSDELRLSIVAALGYDDSQMDLLCENHMLKNEGLRLRRIDETIGTVKISHRSMKAKLSLREGKIEFLNGIPMWRIYFQIPVRQRNTITRNNMSSLAVFLSEIRLTKVITQVAYTENGDLFSFMGTFDNGADISACYLDSQSFADKENLVGSIRFPLSSVAPILDVLGVEAH